MLGLQTQKLTPQVVDFAIRSRCSVFKAIVETNVPLLCHLKQALPGCQFIYRPWWSPEEQAKLLQDPERAARVAYDALMPHLETGLYQWCEGFNEAGLWGLARNYADFTILLAQRLHGAGFHGFLACSFAVGCPPGYADFPYEQDPRGWMEELRRYWGWYFRGLEAADGLALHEYHLPQHDDKFTLYRHRLVWQILPDHLKIKPLFITESGFDVGGDPNNDGWQRHYSAKAYAEFIKGYGAELAKSRAMGIPVRGSTFFGCGMEGWPSFEMLGYPELADAMADVNKAQGGNPMAEEYKWELDFARLGGELGEARVGKPLEGIKFHSLPNLLNGKPEKWAEQWGSKGVMVSKNVPYGSGGWVSGFLEFAKIAPKA